MSVYYNEHDPRAAAWLRELISDGLIAKGDVDERSIVDVQPADVAGYRQVHCFAGLGGWSYALRLAGWPDDRPVWTGSCPCQSFSVAGKGGGTDDPRHLWPAWFRLIRECQPSVVFGEQVAAAIAHGWLDLVADDLEGEGYAVGAVCLPAAIVGAWHLRERLWFVAESQDTHGRRKQPARSTRIGWPGLAGSGAAGELADADLSGCEAQRTRAVRTSQCGQAGLFSADGTVADSPRRGQRINGRTPRHTGHANECGTADGMGDADGGKCGQGVTSAQYAAGAVAVAGIAGRGVGDTSSAGLQERERHGRVQRRAMGTREGQAAQCRSNASAWSDVKWIDCRDGKRRPVPPESALFPLVDGLSPARVGILRGAGNAIVPHVAAEMIRAYMQIEPHNA